MEEESAASPTEVTVNRNCIWRWLRVSLLALTACLALGSVAWGQNWRAYDRDDNYYNHDDARGNGYHNGYRDGLRGGQYDAQSGRRFKFKNDDWKDSRGYEHWMGSKGHYKSAYRDGYERGYRRSYNYQAHQYRYRYDDRWHDRDAWR